MRRRAGGVVAARAARHNTPRLGDAAPAIARHKTTDTPHAPTQIHHRHRGMREAHPAAGSGEVAATPVNMTTSATGPTIATARPTPQLIAVKQNAAAPHTMTPRIH